MRSVSRHAACRARQRDVPPIIIEWLQCYGDERFDGRGAVIRYFGRKGRQRLEQPSADGSSPKQANTSIAISSKAPLTAE